MSEERCFCHLNGYAVKDATARAEIEKLKASEHIDSEARSAAAEASAAAAAVQEQLNQHKAAEVVDSTARSSILSLSNEFNTHKAAEVVDSTARSTASTAQTTANEAKSAAGANANSITGHETRITALENRSSGLTFKEVTKSELQALMTEENVGKMVKFAVTSKVANMASGAFGVIGRLYAGGSGYGVYSGFAHGSSSFFVLGNIQVHTYTCSFSAYQYSIDSGSLSATQLSDCTVKYFIEE